MKLSLNWIKEFTSVELPVDELVRKIGAQLGEVESVEHLADKYRGIVIVRVVGCEDHPNADRLHVCMIDDGGKTQGVERDENGHVQVVCGAPNVREGLLVAWLPPGSTVPESYDKDPFVLGARDLRGIVSNGMLASPKELALGDSREGILEIDPTEWLPNQADIEPGADFAKVFGLDDTIIDIENKMFTHRPDLFGELGLAREVAGITHQQFSSPDWYTTAGDFPSGEGLELAVGNETPELASRFMALAIKDVTIKPSPLWLQCALTRMGQKPVNNVVDVTNFVMLLTAQPTHAYDYDKLRGHQLMARLAKPGESVTLLNHKTYQLDPADIVIADGEGAVGLAGVMGGGDSEVSDQTRNIVLECATFDMYAVRRSAMRHGVFTDALTRFNKGQSPLQNPYVLHLLIQSIIDVAGGGVASPVHDLSTVKGRAWVHPPVPVTPEFINARLGLELSASDMKTLLENVEFGVTVDNDKLTVTAPFWRTDIEAREDIVEEVGRLYGFDGLPLALPRRSIKPAKKNDLLELKQAVRSVLSRGGSSEVLTYSFVHGNLLKKVGQDPEHAFRLSNALSPDLQYYRVSLTPSLLDKIHPNIKAGYDRFSLFEMGKTHTTLHATDGEDGLPQEFDTLAAVYAAADKVKTTGAAYYQARRGLDDLAHALGIALVYTPIVDESGTPVSAPYDLRRSATVHVEGRGAMLGIVGEFTAGARYNLKLPVHSAGFEIDLNGLLQHRAQQPYVQLSKYPAVTQDITLRVAENVPYGKLHETLRGALTATVDATTKVVIKPRGIYRPDDTTDRNITFRISVVSYQKTLTDTEITDLLDAAAELCRSQLSAERI